MLSLRPPALPYIQHLKPDLRHSTKTRGSSEDFPSLLRTRREEGQHLPPSGRQKEYSEISTHGHVHAQLVSQSPGVYAALCLSSCQLGILLSLSYLAPASSPLRSPVRRDMRGGNVVGSQACPSVCYVRGMRPAGFSLSPPVLFVLDPENPLLPARVQAPRKRVRPYTSTRVEMHALNLSLSLHLHALRRRVCCALP